MSVLDLGSLLGELSPEAPCGDNLEYDPAFVELETAMQGKPEAQYGDTVIPAEPPDWKLIKRSALAILGRTRDLRVGVNLTRALINLDGLPGFADGLALLAGYVDKLWTGVHPQLDPDDNNDPTMRVNALASICDAETFLRAVREAPLVSSRVHGRFALRDLEMALGELPVPKDVTKPEITTIDSAFMDVEIAELQATSDALQQSIANTEAIESKLTERVGAGSAADFSALVRMLKRAHVLVVERLARRGVVAPGAEGEQAAAGGEEGAAAGGPGVPVQRISGEIYSRDDVIRMIDKICDYYGREEPSSPVPLLLQRAKRLVPMGFLDILNDMAPEALGPVKKIRGNVEGE